MSDKTYEIRLPAVQDSLHDVYEFVNKVRSEFGLSDQTHFDVELSIEEAVTNVINHAYKEAKGDFVLRMTQNANEIYIEIQDWGRKFDPNTVEPFDYSAPVETRINGGMGMHFMRTLMDSINYHFDENNGTVLSMIKQLESVSQRPELVEQIERELQVFEAVGRALSNERNVDALLDLIVDKLTEVIDADRGTLYLLDPQKGELVSKILQDETGRLTEIRLRIGEGIAGYVAKTGETVNIISAEDDPHFAQYFDQVSGYRTETMICTPTHNSQGEIIGVIQLLNKRNGVFTKRDETILAVLSSQAGIAIENARLITSEREKRRIADTLREISSIINSSLELEGVLQLILGQIERVMPFNSAAILLIEDDNLVARAARGFKQNILQNMPVFQMNDNLLIHEMIETFKPIIIPDVARDKRWLNTNFTAGMHSWMGAPLIVDERVIGQFTVNHQTVDFYHQEHAEVAQTFANQAAAAIERARLHQQTILQARLQQEVDTARTIQSSFLPDEEPEIPGWNIDASWYPAKEVAGDFYDFIELPDDRIGIVIADVCGKGIPASLFMALSRTVFRVLAQADIPPAQLLEKVNNQLKSDSTSNLFVTLFYGILSPNTGELHYCNAGHNPPIFVPLDKTQESVLMMATGPAAGIFPNVSYEDDMITLNPGDVLVMYTDGVTEAIDHGEEEFGEERLLDSITQNTHRSAQEINELITSTVKSFTQERPPDDDATIVILKRN